MTFSIPHVFKALQMLHKEKFVSRATFGNEIHLGEGAVKTLISHLKEAKLIDSTKSGSFLTEKGSKIIKQIQNAIPKEGYIKKCKLIPGKNNYAVLLRNYSYAIKTGLEQRDFAILYGSSGCITMLFHENRFVFPGEREKDCFENDKKTKNMLIEKLEPKEGDVIIISSSNDAFVSEISAKNSALSTIVTS